MSAYGFALAIIASFFGGGAYWGAARAGAGAWLAFTLGLLVFAICFALMPDLLN